MSRSPTRYQCAKKCARCLIRCIPYLPGRSQLRADLRGHLALKAARDHGLRSRETTRLLRALRLS